MDILVPIGILLGMSGFIVGGVLAVLVYPELSGLARYLQFARSVFFALCAIVAAMLLPHWKGAVFTLLMLGLFVWKSTHPQSDMIPHVLLAVTLLFGAVHLRAYLVSLVFLFGLPAGSLFIYKESITRIRAVLSMTTSVYGPLMVGVLVLAVALSSF